MKRSGLKAAATVRGGIDRRNRAAARRRARVISRGIWQHRRLLARASLHQRARIGIARNDSAAGSYTHQRARHLARASTPARAASGRQHRVDNAAHLPKAYCTRLREPPRIAQRMRAWRLAAASRVKKRQSAAAKRRRAYQRKRRRRQ